MIMFSATKLTNNSAGTHYFGIFGFAERTISGFSSLQNALFRDFRVGLAFRSVSGLRSGVLAGRVGLSAEGFSDVAQDERRRDAVQAVVVASEAGLVAED